MPLILGIDPGLRFTGYGLVSFELHHDTVQHIHSGRISTAQVDQDNLPARLKIIYHELCQLMTTHRPDHIVVERVFMNVNGKTTMQLGQARGAAITAIVAQDYPITEYTALQVKKIVTGYGHADKKQIQDHVKQHLMLSPERKLLPDAADALACALCHIFALKNPALLIPAVAKAPPPSSKRPRKKTSALPLEEDDLISLL